MRLSEWTVEPCSHRGPCRPFGSSLAVTATNKLRRSFTLAARAAGTPFHPLHLPLQPASLLLLPSPILTPTPFSSTSQIRKNPSDPPPSFSQPSPGPRTFRRGFYAPSSWFLSCCLILLGPWLGPLRLACLYW